MYTESATRKRTATLNAVTGRSASMIVEVVAGITSVSQGDAASWRRNVVNAWMSTVLPVIQIRTCGLPVERSEEHTSELQSRLHLVCRLLLEKKNNNDTHHSQNDQSV